MENITRKIFQQFKDCADILKANGFANAEGTRILFEADEKVFGTKIGADIANLKEGDIEEVEMKRLPMSRKGKKAMIFSQTFYCQKCLAEAVPFAASLDDMAQIIGPAVYVADGRTADRSSGKSLKKALKRSNGCLVLRAVDGKGKGIGYSITVGRTLHEAATALTVMEKAAEAEWKSERLGGSKPLDKKEVKAMRQNYEKNYSQQTKAETVPTDFPAEETELREHLVTYGNKLTEKRLVQGTWGNLSVRLDSETMLVTPSGIDYALLEAGDMVKVNIHTLKAEGVNKPTSELELHAEIYKAREDAGAVVHAHSKYASVFACACKAIPVASKEKDARELFGATIPVAAYALPGTHTLAVNTASALGTGSAVVMAHHGMAVCGKDMRSAFENALKFEETARVSWYDYEKEDFEEEPEE